MSLIPDALDCPHLNALLSALYAKSVIVKGVPLPSTLETHNYINILNDYESHRQDLLSIDSIKSCIHSLGRPRYNQMLANALASEKFPLKDLASLETGEEVIPEKMLVEALDKTRQTVLQAAQHCGLKGNNAPGGVFHDISDVIEAAKQDKSHVKAIAQQNIASINRILLTIRNIHRHFSSLFKMMNEIMLASGVIAQDFVSAFSQYILAVIESLHLKIGVIEAEMQVSVYGGGTPVLSNVMLAGQLCGEVVRDLDKTIELAQTNLLLYHQLGPSVSKLAIQYHHYLSQIALVKEDLRQFNK